MRNIHRKTTPRVKDGRVQRKNRSAPTPDYWNTTLGFPQIIRERPGQGRRHFLLKRDIERFIQILPHWSELSRGLRGILLATYRDNADGWHNNGIVAICAWQRQSWIEVENWYYQQHKDIFVRLGVECEAIEEEWVCKFTEPQVRAFQLLHVFLHELGHHHDRMSTRSQRKPSRGEGYAESYARMYERQIWDRYVGEFELF